MVGKTPGRSGKEWQLYIPISPLYLWTKTAALLQRERVYKIICIVYQVPGADLQQHHVLASFAVVMLSNKQPSNLGGR